MKKFAFGLRRVLVSRLALLLAGFLCVPSLASAATSIDISSVTNRYFVDFDDFEAFRQGQIADIDQLLLDAYAISNEVSAARSSTLASMMRAQSARNQIDLHQSAQGSSTFLRLATNYLNQSISDSEIALDSCDSSLDDVDSIITDLHTMRSSLENASVPTYQIVVQEGAGGCMCPDYTDILTNLLQLLAVISGDVAQMFVRVDRIDDNVANLVYYIQTPLGAMDEGVTGSVDWDSQDIGYDAFLTLGKAISNVWDYVYYANLYPQIQNGIFSDTPVSQGPAFVREMWNYILRPIAQTLSDYNYATDNRMISGFRDFYIGTHYDFPTNTPFNALNVKLVSDSDSIGGDASNPLYVEVTQSGAPVSVYNPVWITFTNRVSLSADTLAALTNHAGLVHDLLNGVTSAVYTVTILQSSYTEQQEAEREAVNDAAEEADADTSDPDSDTVDLPRTDISRVNNIGGSLRTIYTSYADMFDSVSSDLPDDIMIHQGWTLGGIEVPSMHWNPSDNGTIASMLRLIRGCFSALWFVFYVLVVWSSIAVDIFVAGVCIYSVYGLLLGKPETTLKGIRYMFNLLCSLLGRDPPSK